MACACNSASYKEHPFHRSVCHQLQTCGLLSSSCHSRLLSSPLDSSMGRCWAVYVSLSSLLHRTLSDLRAFRYLQRQTDAGTITFCSLPNFGGSCTSFAAPINQCPALDSSIGDFVQSVDLSGGDGGLVCFICGYALFFLLLPLSFFLILCAFGIRPQYTCITRTTDEFYIHL